MTYREKFWQERPDENVANEMQLSRRCPIEFGYMALRECGFVENDQSFSYDSPICQECWNKEIPEEKKSMTRREKFWKERPDKSRRGVLIDTDEELICGHCPHHFGYEDEYIGCDHNCEACWDREVKIAVEDKKTDIPNEPTPRILDSGNRREFETGAVRDIQEGKGRMDLLPWAAIMEVSKHCENGAKKYGEHNIDKGIPTHSLCDSAARHLAKYLDGWEDEPHLLAATWNLLWAVQMEIKHKELVDTPWKLKQEDTTDTNQE